MPGLRPQATPFPGFSLDHFNYGLQMGADNHGQTQYPWESPFQDPYQNGINPQGQPGMGDMPGPGMGVGPQGPMGPGQDFGPPMDMGGMPSGMDQPTDSPQQNGYQGPSPYGVWGDQDLTNDPAYAQAGQTTHPKWNRFLQYMNTPEAKDSMILGLIMAQSSTDPMGALKLAQQFREHQSQRQWQAQQNQLQREQGEQNIKLRSEYMKQQKSETDERTMYYKTDQARKDLANTGAEVPPLPDDPAAMPSYLEDIRNKLATAQKEKKDRVILDKEKGRAWGQTYKTGAIDEKFQDDPAFQAAAQSYNDRKARADERLDIQRERESQMKAMRENKALKPEVALQARTLDRKLKDTDRDINRYEQNIASIEGNGIYSLLPPDSPMRATYDRQIEAYQKRITEADDKRSKLEDDWDDLVTVRGESTPANPNPSKSPAGTAVKDVTPSPQGGGSGPYSNLTDNAPTDKAKRGFAFAYSHAKDDNIKKMLASEWKRRYGTDPELP